MSTKSPSRGILFATMFVAGVGGCGGSGTTAQGTGGVTGGAGSSAGATGTTGTGGGAGGAAGRGSGGSGSGGIAGAGGSNGTGGAAGQGAAGASGGRVREAGQGALEDLAAAPEPGVEVAAARRAREEQLAPREAGAPAAATPGRARLRSRPAPTRRAADLTR